MPTEKYACPRDGREMPTATAGITGCDACSRKQRLTCHQAAKESAAWREKEAKR